MGDGAMSDYAFPVLGIRSSIQNKIKKASNEKQ